MKKLLILVIVLLSTALVQSYAQGKLIVNPTRVIFDDTKIKESIDLVNGGDDTVTYSVTFIQLKMNENGKLEPALQEDSLLKFAAPFLRIFPRTVTLAPREKQTVSIQLRRTPAMLQGEYRSHLNFKEVLDNKALGDDKPSEDTNSFKVKLTPIMNVSIPVVVTIGSPNVKASLTNLALETVEDSAVAITMIINRSGTTSLSGDLIAEYVPVKGKPYEIGKSVGLGVYANINKRFYTLNLYKTLYSTIKGGTIKIKYIHKDGTVEQVYTENELLVN